MTWEETILQIRSKPEYAELVEKAYLDANIELNVQRFRDSEEFSETIAIFKEQCPNAKRILDIGCGNGISSINFALLGYDVTSIEPNNSITVGSGAIKLLKEKYNLPNVSIIESFAEDANLDLESYDIVYCRQSLHHANNLYSFIQNSVRFLKVGGLFISIRDHVIYSKKDKQQFLNAHPLHAMYGGENAFKRKEYIRAFTHAGLRIKKELRHYDSVINYFPEKTSEVLAKQRLKNDLFKAKIGFLSNSIILQRIYTKYSGILDEQKVLCRVYSYICIKT